MTGHQESTAETSFQHKRVGHLYTNAQQLKDSCRTQLLAAELDIEDITKLMALKQTVTHLPAGRVEWVQFHWPVFLNNTF